MADRGDIIDELARVFDHEDAAHHLLDRVDFPRERRPRFTTPILFWRQIRREIENGLTHGGPDGLRRHAAKLYPGNPAFRPPAPVPPTFEPRGRNSLRRRNRPRRTRSSTDWRREWPAPSDASPRHNA